MWNGVLGKSTHGMNHRRFVTKKSPVCYLRCMCSPPTSRTYRASRVVLWWPRDDVRNEEALYSYSPHCTWCSTSDTTDSRSSLVTYTLLHAWLLPSHHPPPEVPLTPRGRHFLWGCKYLDAIELPRDTVLVPGCLFRCPQCVLYLNLYTWINNYSLKNFQQKKCRNTVYFVSHPLRNLHIFSFRCMDYHVVARDNSNM